MGDAQGPSVSAEQLSKLVGKPAAVPKNPSARKRSDLTRAVGELKGVLDLGPKTPNRPYIAKRCRLMQGKTPMQAIEMQYIDAEGEARNYKPSDLMYDLKKNFLVRVDTSNLTNDQGQEYDFGCLADVQEYFHKESLIQPNGRFKNLSDDIVEMAMWATEETDPDI